MQRKNEKEMRSTIKTTTSLYWALYGVCGGEGAIL